MNFDISQLFQGNNWIILVLGLFLFKDQLIALLTPKPKPVDPTVPVVVPVPSPGPAPIIVPPDHPLVDVFIKQVLPILIPLLIHAGKAQEPPK